MEDKQIRFAQILKISSCFHPSKFAENLFHVSFSSFPSFEKKNSTIILKVMIARKILYNSAKLFAYIYDYIRLLEIKTLELAPISLQPSFNFLELSSIIVR